MGVLCAGVLSSGFLIVTGDLVTARQRCLVHACRPARKRFRETTGSWSLFTHIENLTVPKRSYPGYWAWDRRIAKKKNCSAASLPCDRTKRLDLRLPTGGGTEDVKRPGPVAAVVARVAIWLILPVVICLSQRLSHACLSTSLTKVKPRMAH